MNINKKVILIFSLTSFIYGQQVFNVEAIYPPGQEAAKTGDYIWVRAQVLPVTGVDSVWLNANSIGGPVNVLMYDDGNHHDGLAGDGVWGSDSVLVDSVGTAYHTVTVYAQILPNPPVSNRGVVGVDNQRPFISNVQTVYPSGQTAVKENDQIRITAYISDVKGYVDVVMGMDNSSSMCDTVPGDTISKWRAAELAAFSFLDNLEPEDRAALYRFYDGFGTEESLVVHFTTDKQLVKDSIDAADPPCPSGLGTALYDMIVEASLYAQISPNIPAVIIMTDGVDTWSNEYSRSDCYFQPVPIFTIGFGDTADIDEEFLDSVATTSAGGKYYYAPSAEELDSIYQEISNIIASWEAPKGVQQAWVDATPFGGPSQVFMYDDGEHEDGAAGDTIYGSRLITISTTVTDSIEEIIHVLDVAHNERQDIGVTYIDNIPPYIFDSLKVTYPAGKNVVHNGEKVFFTLGVRDTGIISGIEVVTLDAVQLGGPPNVLMHDDGIGNDTLAGDGIFTSDSITVNADGFSGTAPVYVYARDIAYNLTYAAGGVLIDNVPPQLSDITVIYPDGQSASKVGDYVIFEALVFDELSGVDDTTVVLNSINIDGVTHIMVDDGTNGDRVGGDNIYSYGVIVTNGITDTVTFTVSARDLEGNQSGPLTGYVILDNTEPVLYSVDIQNEDDIFRNGETVNLLITNDAPGYTVNVDFSPIDFGYVEGAETVQDNGDGTYSVSYTLTETNSRPDSVYTIFIYVTDGVGLADTGSVELILDNTSPSLSNLNFILDPLNDSILNTPDTLFVIAQDERGIVSVQYFIDAPGGTPFPMVLSAPGADSVNAKAYFDISPLSEGFHRVYVEAADSAGNSSNYAELDFIKDTEGPTIEEIQIVYPEGQNAVRDSQEIKILALIRDVTTKVDTSTVKVDATYLNGNPFFSMRDDGTGGDEFAGDNVYTAALVVSTGLNGPQPFTITASDIAPNTSLSDTGFVVLDNTVPLIVSITVEDPDNIYRNNETIHLLVAADESGYDVNVDFSPIDEYYVEGAENVQDNGDGTYKVTYTIKKNNTRPDSTYLIYVVTIDGVGLSDTDSVYLVLDNTGPYTSGLDFVIDPLNDNIINAPDTIIALITDSNGVIDAEYFVDVIGPSGDGIHMALDVPGNTNVTVKGYLPIWGLYEGHHTVYVHGRDSSGAWGSFQSMDFILDTQGPLIENIEIVYPEGQEAVRDDQEIIIKTLIKDITTEVDSITVFIDATYLNGDDSLLMYDDGSNGDEFARDNVYTRKFTITSGLNGPQPFTITASDIVPNTSLSDTGIVVLDNTNPVVTTVISQDPDNIYRNGETINLLMSTDAAGYEISANFYSIDINYMEGAENVQDNGDGTYGITYTISSTNSRPNGHYSITLIARDEVGLSDTGSITLYLDNLGPVVLSLSLDDPNDTLNMDDTLRITAYDSSGVVALEYFVDNTGSPGTGIPILIANLWGSDTVTAKTHFPIAELPEGPHMIYVDARDSSGNWGGFATLGFLKDTKPPLIQDVSVNYPDEQKAVSKGQKVVITALIEDITTLVDPDSVYVDVSSFSDSLIVKMYDNGVGEDESEGDNVYTAEVVVTFDSSGIFAFTIHAADVVTNHGTKGGTIILDNRPPEISIAVQPMPEGAPLNGNVYVEEILLRGSYFDLPDSSVEGVRDVVITVQNGEGEDINDSPIEIPVTDGDFSRVLRLVEGLNVIKVHVKDWAGLVQYDSAVIYYIVPEVTGEIGPEGGTVESPDGAKIVIPEGALNSTIQISIKSISREEIPPSNNGRISLLRIAHEFTPPNLVFLKPVEITLPYTDFSLDLNQDDSLDFVEAELIPFFYDGNIWLKAGEPTRDTIQNRVTFSTNHLSIYSLGMETGAPITELRVGWTKNPFKVGENSTFIFEIPTPGKVSLKIVDLSGDVVREIVTKKDYSASGRYNLQWDGLGDFNRGFKDFDRFPGSGIYIYIFEFEGTDGKKKIIRKPIGVLK